MPSNPNTKSANIQSDAHALLMNETKRLKVSQLDYVTACVRYFAERGLNPIETEAREGQLIMQQVKKLGDRIFSYLQEQERGLLMPMLEEMLRTRMTVDRVLRLNEILVYSLTKEVANLNEEQLKAYQESLTAMQKQNDDAINERLNDAISTTQKASPGKKKQ